MQEKHNKKPRISDSLATKEIQGFASAEADQHKDRIARFGILKHRSKLQEQYLWKQVDFSAKSQKQCELSKKALKAATKLQDCGQFLIFRNYYTIDQVKLEKFYACGQHLLCPMCAGIRAARSMKRYIQRLEELMRQKPKLKPVLLTLTVKNGSDLDERFSHLTRSFRVLLQRYRDYKKKARGFNEFCKIDGAFYTTEYTYNKKTNEWHPHIHIFALLNDWIDHEQLSETWHDITSDSYIVDVRRVRKDKIHGYTKAVAEVCKYALKFSDLSVQDTWQAFLVLKGKRLTGSFGSMHGIKIPDSPVDEMPQEELPYIELFYNFVFGDYSHYNLLSTRQIDVNAKNERGRERRTERIDLTRPNEFEHEEKKDAETRSCGAFHDAPMRVKSSAEAWRISPWVRYRTKKRIKRWDGYLYNLDLFPFVEKRLLQFIN